MGEHCLTLFNFCCAACICSSEPHGRMDLWGKEEREVVVVVCVWVCVWGLRRRRGETGGKRMREERRQRECFPSGFFGWTCPFCLRPSSCPATCFVFESWLSHDLDFYLLQNVAFVLVLATFVVATHTPSCSIQQHSYVCCSLLFMTTL